MCGSGPVMETRPLRGLHGPHGWPRETEVAPTPRTTSRVSTNRNSPVPLCGIASSCLHNQREVCHVSGVFEGFSTAGMFRANSGATSPNDRSVASPGCRSGERRRDGSGSGGPVPVPASPDPGRPSHWPAVHAVWDARRIRLKRTLDPGAMWSAQTNPFVETTSGGCPETVLLGGKREDTRANQVTPTPVPLSLAQTTGAMPADTARPGPSPRFASGDARRCRPLSCPGRFAFGVGPTFVPGIAPPSQRHPPSTSDPGTPELKSPA